MTVLLSDPKGQGGAGGGLRGDSVSGRARDTVELVNVSSGQYDVLGVCTSSGTVHIAVKTPESPGRVLATSDIACGATLRIPVTVTVTVTVRDLVFEATKPGTPA